MAFKLQPPESFHAAAEIPEPGGSVQTLQVEFKWISRRDFIERCKASSEQGDAEFFADLILGWDADEPCDAAGLEKLFAFRPKAGRALFEVYRRELLEVEQKN